MGIDPAPFWANLYLSKQECDFLVGYLSKTWYKLKRLLFLHLIMKENFENHTKKFTPRNGKISTNLYDKRYEFSFFVVHMQNFHGTVMSETLRIKISSFSVFFGKTIALITRMEKQGGNMGKLIKRIHEGI